MKKKKQQADRMRVYVHGKSKNRHRIYHAFFAKKTPTVKKNEGIPQPETKPKTKNSRQRQC